MGSRENLHLVERWTRTGPDTLEYAVTIEDPTVWTRPWTVKEEFTKQSDKENRIYYEPRCHEGNYGLPVAAARGPSRGEGVRGRSRPASGHQRQRHRLRRRRRQSARRSGKPVMRIRLNGSMISVAIVAAVVGAVVSVSMSVTQTPSGQTPRPGRDRRTSRISAASGRPTTKRTGTCRRTPRGRRRHAARRLSVRLRAGAGSARSSRSAPPAACRLARRRAGRRRDPVHARSAGDQEGERRATGSTAIPSSSATCRASRARCTCRIRSRSRRARTRSTWRTRSRPRRARSIWTRSIGPPADTWMGHSVGRWDGDTLVVDVTDFNDKTWFDRAGNFHSDALHLTERFTLMTPDVIQYEVTIEDPKVFTRPWRIAMPLYRRMEPNMQLLEYRLHGIRRGVPVRTRPQGAAGQAVGGRNDDRRHHAQGAARRSVL